MSNKITDNFIKERNNAVIEAFKGNYEKLYSYMIKWHGNETCNLFKIGTDEYKRITVCKMICSITSEDITPYKHEAENWLIEHGYKPFIE